jgi:hypothetical protein
VATLTAWGLFLAGLGAIISGLAAIYQTRVRSHERYNQHRWDDDRDDNEPPGVVVRPPDKGRPGPPKHRANRNKRIRRDEMTAHLPRLRKQALA